MDKKAEHVGVAGEMPGTNGGFTMAAFTAESVPHGTKLYIYPQSTGDLSEFDKWYTKRYAALTRKDEWADAQRADALEIWNAALSAKSIEWNTGDPDVRLRSVRGFIVAVQRQGFGEPFIFEAYYANELQISTDGEFLAKGWYQKGLGAKYYKLLRTGDVLRGWMELPVFDA